MAKLSALKEKIKAVPLPVRPQMRDPRMTGRIVVGILLVANAVAAAFAFRPWADSALQLEQQLITLKKQQISTRADIERLKILVKKSDQARVEGDRFLGTYFLGRRAAASTLASELNAMAKGSLRAKEHSFAVEPVEGSDTLAMMTITANYEGTYADLVNYINKLDRSPRFFIVESLAAAPQQGGAGVLNISMKVNVFVREDNGVLKVPTKAELLAGKDAKPEAGQKEAPTEQPAPPPGPKISGKMGAPVEKAIAKPPAATKQDDAQKKETKKGAAR